MSKIKLEKETSEQELVDLRVENERLCAALVHQEKKYMRALDKMRSVRDAWERAARKAQNEAADKWECMIEVNNGR